MQPVIQKKLEQHVLVSNQSKQGQLGNSRYSAPFQSLYCMAVHIYLRYSSSYSCLQVCSHMSVAQTPSDQQLSPGAASGEPCSQLWSRLITSTLCFHLRRNVSNSPRRLAGSVLVWQKELPSTTDPRSRKKERFFFCIHQHF